MARNASEANDAIFERLIQYAADRGVTIPGGKRQVFLDKPNYDDLVGSKQIEHMRFGRHQAAALLNTPSGAVLVVAGFEAEEIPPSTHVREVEVTPGLAVAAIVDLDVAPRASPAKILNVVAVAAMGDPPDYSGHDVQDVLSLFPRIRIMEVDSEVEAAENFAANLLTVCAAEAAEGNGWIDESLAGDLVQLAEQRIAQLPYEFVVRATLDLNPQNLFLALYRCLEATYAYARASDLAKKLGLNSHRWYEVAQALGDSLNWYPRHDQSLATVLVLPAVSGQDLRALATSLGKDPLGNNVAERVAEGIRDLRNSLVHYGPTSSTVSRSTDEWNGLCAPLASVVGSVFAFTYGNTGSSRSIPQPNTPDRAARRLGWSTRKERMTLFLEGLLQWSGWRR